jgi:mannose/cellobiose epimerase-like protein (N-acyl-D-glucosamine 2-epimerase family)
VFAVTPSAPIIAAHARFRDWLFGIALPFWAADGMDSAGLGFQEALALDGSPFNSPFKRLRVQARQIYVYAHAATLGWDGGLAAAGAGYAFIHRHGRLLDGGWAKLLGPSGGVLDASSDLYDLSFVLLALTWLARASGDEEPLRLAQETEAWIWRTMRAPSSEPGLENALPRDPGPRQQNPHMHLLEATLALYELAPSPGLREHVVELCALFDTAFFDQPTGTLGEFFDRALRPAADELGDHVEPGHHYEWIWLLHRCELLVGRPTAEPIGRLYAFADQHGTDPATGLVMNTLRRDGSVRDAGSRLWPQTEALRAHLTMAVRSNRSDPVRIAATVDRLMQHYLDRVPNGTWMDALDAAQAPLSQRVPASSLYHLMTGYAALDAYVRDGSV